MERGLFNVVAVFDGTVPLTLKFDAPSKGGMGSDPPASESHSLVFLEIKPSLQVSAWLDGLASCAPPPVPPEGALPESHRCAGGEEVPGEAVPPDPGHGVPPPRCCPGFPLWVAQCWDGLHFSCKPAATARTLTPPILSSFTPIFSI